MSSTIVLTLSAAGCGFQPAPLVSEPMLDAVDSPIDTPPTARWIVAGVNTTSSFLTIHPFQSHFSTACPNQTSPVYAYRQLAPHPSLPFVFGVESEFWGIGLGCSAVTTTMVSGGGPRPIQRIVTNPTASVGFFTADGPLAVGVYRFTALPDGTPTAQASANSPSAAGALALDAVDGQLFVAGANAIYQYVLVGGALDFPAGNVNTAAPMCGSPVDLIESGASLLAFCNDSPQIRRYTRSPFVYDTNVGTLGTVIQVVALPSDRAIAARISPPSLAILSLNSGTPVITNGPTLSFPITAIAASSDGQLLVTAEQLDPSTSRLTAWSINAQTLTQLDTQTQAGTVTTLAVTTPGT